MGKVGHMNKEEYFAYVAQVKADKLAAEKAAKIAKESKLEKERLKQK